MPNISFPQMGEKVIAKIIDSKGPCTIGMKPGDEFEVSMRKCGNLCGFLYHNIFGAIKTLQFGGTIPLGDNPDIQIWDCPNPYNRIKIELRRVKK